MPHIDSARRAHIRELNDALRASFDPKLRQTVTDGRRQFPAK